MIILVLNSTYWAIFPRWRSKLEHSKVAPSGNLRDCRTPNLCPPFSITLWTLIRCIFLLRFYYHTFLAIFSQFLFVGSKTAVMLLNTWPTDRQTTTVWNCRAIVICLNSLTYLWRHAAKCDEKATYESSLHMQET